MGWKCLPIILDGGVLKGIIQDKGPEGLTHAPHSPESDTQKVSAGGDCCVFPSALSQPMLMWLPRQPDYLHFSHHWPGECPADQPHPGRHMWKCIRDLPVIQVSSLPRNPGDGRGSCCSAALLEMKGKKKQRREGKMIPSPQGSPLTSRSSTLLLPPAQKP